MQFSISNISQKQGPNIRKSTSHDKYYDQLFWSLWDFTTGTAGTPEDCYEAARYFAIFCLNELERQSILVRQGETALVRRGLIPSPQIMNAWIFNAIEDCSLCETPIPAELSDVLYIVLGCNHRTADNKSKEFNEFKNSMSGRLGYRRPVDVRATARRYGVSPSTVSRLVNDPELEFDQARLDKIRKMTGFSDFLKTLPHPWIPKNSKKN